MKPKTPSSLRVLTLVLSCAAALVANDGPSRAQGSGRVIGVGDFPHGVSNIEQAIAFYRDVLGFELLHTRPPVVDGKIGPNVYDAKMQAVMDVGGAYYRFATFRIPGAGFHLQLVEMINNQRIVGLRGRRQSSATPLERGSVMMRLPVADVDHWLKRIRDGFHGDVLTTELKQGAAQVESFAFRDDPDGFLMEVVQGSGAGIVLTAADPDEKLRFYRELLGFDLQRGERVPSAAHEPVSVRRSIGRVPGTDVPFEIREYQGVHQRRFYPSTMGQDGVAWIQLLVRDLDALMRVFIAERVLIVSTGLQPVVVDDGTRRVVVRDPDGVFVELIERTTDNRGER